MSAQHQVQMLHTIAESTERPGYVAVRHLIKLTDGSEDSVRQTVKQLARLGMIEPLQRRDGSRALGWYKLTRAGRRAVATGEFAGTVRVGFSPAAPERQPALSELQERAWRAMRLQQRFTISSLLDVLVNADDAEEKIVNVRCALQRYARLLVAAQYLVLMPADGLAHRYFLVRDTGPKCPAIYPTLGRVVDRNEAAVSSIEPVVRKRAKKPEARA